MNCLELWICIQCSRVSSHFKWCHETPHRLVALFTKNLTTTLMLVVEFGSLQLWLGFSMVFSILCNLPPPLPHLLHQPHWHQMWLDQVQKIRGRVGVKFRIMFSDLIWSDLIIYFVPVRLLADVAGAVIECFVTSCLKYLPVVQYAKWQSCLYLIGDICMCQLFRMS